jgi:hypothetical protein
MLNPHCGSVSQHCTALHCTVLHCTALHFTALHFTALYCTLLYFTALYCTALNPTTGSSPSPPALHCTALHCTALGHRECKADAEAENMPEMQPRMLLYVIFYAKFLILKHIMGSMHPPLHIRKPSKHYGIHFN